MKRNALEIKGISFEVHQLTIVPAHLFVINILSPSKSFPEIPFMLIHHQNDNPPSLG